MTKPTPSCKIEKARAFQRPSLLDGVAGIAPPALFCLRPVFSRPLSCILSELDKLGQGPKEAGDPFRPKEPPAWQIATRLQTFPAP